MNEPDVKAGRPRPRGVTLIAAAFLIMLYAVLCGIVYITEPGRRLPDLLLREDQPAPTVPVVQTPQIQVRPPQEQTHVKFDDFSDNRHDWASYYLYGKVEVVDGRLVLQSGMPDVMALGLSRQFRPDSGLRYYIQADFTTDVRTEEGFGLVFGLSRNAGTYYAFYIWPRTAALYKTDAYEWETLVPETSITLKPYPQVNTLGVYFERGETELYINGELMASYVDEDPLEGMNVAAFAGNTGYRVIVDNFFIYRGN
jgi:hypothetical protein